MRTLVMGDIHGAYLALTQVLERCEYNPKEDRLICLGDYVDGWSDSALVIDLLVTLKEEAKDNLILIRGNHDVWAGKWLSTGESPLIWTENGGKATMQSYISNPDMLLKTSHKKFFKNLENFYIDDENRGFVHGGFTSRKGLGHETYQSDYYWDRDLWNLALLSHSNSTEDNDYITRYIKRFYNHTKVFIGHTSTTNWKNKPHLPEWDGNDAPITIPMKRHNVINMDTGAGYRGKLSVMDVDTEKFWQSDFVKELYPDQEGRRE